MKSAFKPYRCTLRPVFPYTRSLKYRPFSWLC